MRVQHFVLANIKGNIEAPHHWSVWREFTGTLRDCNAESASISGHHVIYLVKPASCSTWYIALYDATALPTYVCLSVLWTVDMSTGIQDSKANIVWSGTRQMSMTTNDIHRFELFYFQTSPTLLLFSKNYAAFVVSDSRVCFLSLAWSKLRLCSANDKAGYFSNLAYDLQNIVWACSERETEIRPSSNALFLNLLCS